MLTRLGLGASVAVLAALSATPVVSAQTPPVSNDASSAAPAASSDATQGLEEVIVTAQRRTENLQHAPVAVAVVGGDALRNANVSALSGLQDMVPALTVENAPTGNLTFIRGVGNFTLTNNSDPATAFNYDDVYIARPIASDGVFYDLERVEILKGPQGTLYGRNATAGALNVLPVLPRLGETSGYVSASLGNYNARSTEGAINLPVGAESAFRLSGNYVVHDGYLKDGTSDEDTHALRAQFLSNISPDLTIRASVDYSHQGGNGVGGSYANRITFDPSTNTYSDTPSGIGLDEGFYTARSQAFLRTLVYPAIGANATDLTEFPFRDNDYYGAHLHIDWHTSLGTFTLIPSWRQDKLHYVPATGFSVEEHVDTEVKSLEGRFASERFGIFDINAGGSLYDEDLHQIIGASLGGAALFQDADYGTRSEAAYLRATAHVSDSLRFTAGARFTHDRKSVDETDTNLIIICGVFVAGAPSCPTTPLLPFTHTLDEQPVVPTEGGPPVPLGASGSILLRLDPTQHDEISTSEWTYRGAVEYDLSATSLAYASIETGYRSGGFNPAGSAPYAPEFITAYTLGLKNRLFDNHVQLNLEGFVWKYRDQQLSFTGLDLNGGPANITANVGRLTLQGAEAEVRWLVTPDTILSADLQYLDSNYDEFVYQAPVIAGFPYTGCGVSPNVNPALFDVNCTDRSAYNAPKWTLNVGAEHTIPMGQYQLTLSADSQFRSSRYNFFNFVPGQLVEASWRSNAQATWGPSDESWSIAAFVRNIENERTQVFGPEHPFLPTLTVQTQAPRTVGVRFTAKF